MRLASRGVQKKLLINGIASKVCTRWPDMLTANYEDLKDTLTVRIERKWDQGHAVYQFR